MSPKWKWKITLHQDLVENLTFDASKSNTKQSFAREIELDVTF